MAKKRKNKPKTWIGVYIDCGEHMEDAYDLAVSICRYSHDMLGGGDKLDIRFTTDNPDYPTERGEPKQHRKVSYLNLVSDNGIGAD
jgi:hypothetical protein